MFEIVETVPSAVIRVIGVGGGGGNAVAHMLNAKIEGVEFICANTDAQAIRSCPAKTVLQLGQNVTKGLGAGAKPEKGRMAALEDKERIIATLEGADMLFITAGMGGGTGTGAAPIIAQYAREMGILTVAVVTKPFSFEGHKRMQQADTGIEELSKNVDSIIVIPNDKLISVLGKDAPVMNAFRAANDVLLGAVQGIAEIITGRGYMNVDFADVRTVMFENGTAMMGTGTARGEDRATRAVDAALHNKLLEEFDLKNADGVLVNITSGENITMSEYAEINSTITQYASDDATVVIGAVFDPDMQDELRVTVVVTGVKSKNAVAKAFEPASANRRGVPVNPQLRIADTDNVATHNPMSAKTPMSPEPNRSMRPATDGQGRAVENDYLDIPAFLRRQAD